MLEAFHFLRPWWLLAFIPVGLIGAAMWRCRGMRGMWSDMIDEHLIHHLIIRPEQRNRIEPWHVLLVFGLVLVFALAGPSWRREPSPFASDEAALVIVVKVTSSMLADDIQPTRLEKASQKIHELLDQRQGSTSALVAYSGSSHLVMPLTRDPTVIDYFASELAPEIMPREGDDFLGAIELATSQLKSAQRSGSIVVMADRIAPEEIDTLKNHKTSSDFPVHILGFGMAVDDEQVGGGSPEDAPDYESLASAADILNGSMIRSRPDDKDVEQLARRLETDLVESRSESTGQRWQDAGYWLVPILVVLVLFSFRAGWLVKWD